MEFSDRLDSKCSSRSAKVSREQNKFEFQKTKDSLARSQDFNEKIMTKEEKEMKKQLERLEKAKEKIERRRSSITNPEEMSQQKSSLDLHRSSHNLDVGIRSDKGILAQARSRRELIDRSLDLSKQESIETASTSKKPKASPERRMTISGADGNLHRDKSSERRHSIAVSGYDSGKTSSTATNYKIQSFLKGKSTQIPQIVISDLTTSTENLTQVTTDHKTSLGNLYDMAVAVAEETKAANKTEIPRKDSLHGKKSEEKKLSSISLSTSDSTRMDLMKLKELETLLKEARAYNERRNKDQHLGKTAERQQRRRLEYLMQLLEELHGKQKPEFTPSEILNCGYLRLSKSNVETLEDMIRESGKDPGIHVHSDTTNINIFENLQAERTDVIRQPPILKSPSPTKGLKTSKHHL